jgi:uncharacterized protein (DUF1330 family)
VSEPVSIEPTAEQVKRLAATSGDGPIIMVNLLRFRDEAGPPDEGVSGAEAYGRYAAAIPPFLERAGGRLLSAVACREGVVGPDDAEWDVVALVEYPSREAFLGMISDPEYLEIHRHRAAALADSRLILSSLAMPTGSSG